MLFLRATSSHPSLLVPNLRVLRWRPCIVPQAHSALPIIFIQRLLSPSLVSLHVNLNDTDEVTLQSFLANHPFLCPNLKAVSIDFGRCQQLSRTTIEILSRAIPHHEHLECLCIPSPIDDVALTHIAMSPKLKTLTLMLHFDKSKSHQVCIPSDTIPFRNVESLSLKVWDLYFVTTLLRNQDQMFRCFVLCYRSGITTEAAFALFTALTSRQRTHSLRSIRIEPDFSEALWYRSPPAELDELWTRYHLTYDTFRPLTPLCHLHELVVDLGYWFSIDDDDLLSLTRNWPLLRVLRLDCKQRVDGYIWESAKYVTFKGLLSLLECCPDLHDLCLPLDATVVPVNTGDIICNPALTCIHFLNSRIGHPDPVAEILARHFPSVAEVECSFTLSPFSEGGPDVEPYIESWFDVNTLLDTHFSDHDDPDS
jgi:hypothetical protein